MAENGGLDVDKESLLEPEAPGRSPKGRRPPPGSWVPALCCYHKEKKI
jgi:hypothetical protein